MAKILIVDDEKSIRDALSDILSEEKYDVITAEDGEDGWAKLEQEKIDLVVSDVELQNFNGFDFGESIRMLMKEEIPLMYFSKDREKQIDYYMNEQSRSCFVINAFEGNELQEKFLKMLDEISSMNPDIEYDAV